MPNDQQSSDASLEDLCQSLINALADIQVQIAALEAAVQKLSNRSAIVYVDQFRHQAKRRRQEFLERYQQKILPLSSPE
jgi:hypothetical protein